MTKKEIVKTISEEIGMTQQKTKEIVQKTFDAIVEAIVLERRIELRNFGVFEVKRRAARRARNPKTGERVEVESKLVVSFKPGKEMEARVREIEERERLFGTWAAEAAQQGENQPPVDGAMDSPTGKLHPKTAGEVPKPRRGAADQKD